MNAFVEFIKQGDIKGSTSLSADWQVVIFIQLTGFNQDNEAFLYALQTAQKTEERLNQPLYVLYTKRAFAKMGLIKESLFTNVSIQYPNSFLAGIGQ